jgi:hypothetical protein
MPTRLADRHRMALEDPTLLELTSEVALLDVRIGELLSNLPEEASEADADTWRELLTLVEQRRKLVDSERKREVELQLTLSAAQARALVGALMTAVVECVSSMQERAAIARRVESLMALPGELVIEDEGDGDDAA